MQWFGNSVSFELGYEPFFEFGAFPAFELVEIESYINCQDVLHNVIPVMLYLLTRRTLERPVLGFTSTEFSRLYRFERSAETMWEQMSSNS